MNSRVYEAPTPEVRSNSINGGVPQERILESLKTPKFIQRAVKSGRCFVCRAQDIDVTGLCLVCRSFLNDEEREATRPYYDGAF